MLAMTVVEGLWGRKAFRTLSSDAKAFVFFLMRPLRRGAFPGFIDTSSVGDLSDATGIGEEAIGKALDELEASGFIVRDESAVFSLLVFSLEGRNENQQAFARNAIALLPETSRVRLLAEGAVGPALEAAAATSAVKGKPRAAARRSSRCPADFVLTDALRAEAEECGLAPERVEIEFAKMRDCEFRTPRSDWKATWRNWARSAAESQPRARQRQVGFLTAAEKTMENLRRLDLKYGVTSDQPSPQPARPALSFRDDSEVEEF